LRSHGWLALKGVVPFAANCLAAHEAEREIPSAPVTVLVCIMVFGNAGSGRLLFERRPTRRFLVAAVRGAGVAQAFWPEVSAARSRPQAALGLRLELLAVRCACTGNSLTLVLMRRGLPLVPMLVHAIAYGAAALALVALAAGGKVQTGSSVAWCATLAYLWAFGSVLAFVVYFRLAQRGGPQRAALTGVAIPPIATAISALFVGWKPDALSLAGVAACLVSVYVATRPNPDPTERVAAPARLP
jgi:drug/metabolite transporter (DMT)-like permease